MVPLLRVTNKTLLKLLVALVLSCCKETYSSLANIEINELGSLVCYEAAEVTTNKAMPPIKLMTAD